MKFIVLHATTGNAVRMNIAHIAFYNPYVEADNRHAKSIVAFSCGAPVTVKESAEEIDTLVRRALGARDGDPSRDVIFL